MFIFCASSTGRCLYFELPPREDCLHNFKNSTSESRIVYISKILHGSRTNRPLFKALLKVHLVSLCYLKTLLSVVNDNADNVLKWDISGCKKR